MAIKAKPKISENADVPIEPRSIFLRGYVVRDKKPKQGIFDPEAEEIDPVPHSEWSLTFDCETTIDEAQALRFGAYQVRKDGILWENGLFHSEDISHAELTILKTVAAADGLKVRTVRHFVDFVLFDRIYALGGVVIGFNLPFDISRLALAHGSARGTMRGGFSFKLSKNTDWPRVRVKHISAKMAFIRFGAPPKKRTPAGQAKRGLVVPPRRGSFVDVKTLASGLLSGGHSLLSLSNDTLKVEHPKFDVDEHGGDLKPEYVEYCLRDVQATWECYEMLAKRLNGYALATIEPKTLYSEASLGKAYLKQMGVKPWRELQPDFPPELIGQIISTYFGGRAEVNIRRRKTQVLYCDFLSMYPTVCTLMGLWRFVIAKRMTWRDATAEIQALLNRISPDDMMKKSGWPELTTLVQLRPDDDILPVRSRYGTEPASNIGVNRLSSPDQPLWFTLADVIASKMLGGKTPIVERAVRFDFEGVQDGLQPINIIGNPEFHVEPATSDFYCRVIDLRRDVKLAEKAEQNAGKKSQLDREQLALKILANATSYGIFIEMIVQDLEKSEILTGYGVDGHAFDVHTNKYEEPGVFFHPVLATLITGAARLMLALAERRTKDAGLDWVFCDTDSIAIAKPDGMDHKVFIPKAREVCEAFGGLNPYKRQGGSILQIEKQNFAPGAEGDWDSAPRLYCFAVSAKRYALFNEDPTTRAPIIRKASAHGLGHLQAPYIDPDKDTRADRLKHLNVDLWQEDLWKRIITAVENPEQTDGGVVTDLDQDGRLDKSVASRYAATTPALLSWFKIYNRGKPYEAKVRPFNFLLSLQSEKMEQIAHGDPEAQNWWRLFKRDPAPTAPYDTDPAKAAIKAFDRHRRNEKIPVRWLKTYAAALADYHLQPEPKFFGGDVRRASGKLRRRHVKCEAVQHIGKEANQWEEAQAIGEDDAEIPYGMTPEARTRCVATIKEARKRFSVRKFVNAAHVTDRTIAFAVNGQGSDQTLAHLAEVANVLLGAWAQHDEEERDLLEWAFLQTSIEGLYKFSERVGVDPSNLGKALKGNGRRVSLVVLEKLVAAKSASGISH